MDNTIVQNNAEQSAPEESAQAVELDRIEVVPPVDVFENADEILLRVDMPGVREDAIELCLDRRTLTLRGDATGSDRTFARTFTLPETVDAGAVSAELEHGVLEVHLGKREEMKPRTIAVTAR